MTVYWDKAKDGLWHAQELMQSIYNQTKHAPIKYQDRDKVMLDVWHLKLHWPLAKLSERFLGPFEILNKEGRSAYHLKLPKSSTIHPVFNELLLQPHIGPKFPGQDIYNQPPLDLIDDQEEFDVKEILDTRIWRKWREYLVKWKGYRSEDNTWEPKSNLEHSPLAVAAFHKRLSLWKWTWHPPRKHNLSSTVFT